MEEQVPGAGWYDDGTGQTRWWDGAAWTQHVAPASAASAAAPAEPAAAAAPAVPAAASTAPAAQASPAAQAAAQPLRPGAADPRRELPREDRAPEVPVTEQTFVPSAFLAEQSFQPELALAGAGAPKTFTPAAPATSYLHRPDPEAAAAVAGTSSRFGGAAVSPSRAGYAGLDTGATVVETSNRGRNWLIAATVVVVLAILASTAWRTWGPDSAPKANDRVVAAAVASATPNGDLPRGFTSVGDVGGYKLLKSCGAGGSCRTVQIAARATCKRLSALVLFASGSGNPLGSDVVMAKNVKAGKAVTLQAAIPAGGGSTVRVSSVVCQQF